LDHKLSYPKKTWNEFLVNDNYVTIIFTL